MEDRGLSWEFLGMGITLALAAFAGFKYLLDRNKIVEKESLDRDQGLGKELAALERRTLSSEEANRKFDSFNVELKEHRAESSRQLQGLASRIDRTNDLLLQHLIKDRTHEGA